MKNKSLIIEFKALLAGWVTIVFVTSMLVYFLYGNKEFYHSNNLLNILRGIWEIADEIGPAVKVSIIVMLGALIYMVRKILKNRFFYFANICSSLIAVIVVLVFLPENISRGYGIGLTGFRLDKLLPIYLLGATIGGIVYSLVSNQQKKKMV